MVFKILEVKELLLFTVGSEVKLMLMTWSIKGKVAQLIKCVVDFTNQMWVVRSIYLGQNNFNRSTRLAREPEKLRFESQQKKTSQAKKNIACFVFIYLLTYS